MSTDILLAAIIGLLVAVVVVAVIGYEASTEVGGALRRMRTRLWRRGRALVRTPRPVVAPRAPAIGEPSRHRRPAEGNGRWPGPTILPHQPRRSRFLQGEDLARVQRWLGRDPNTFEHLLFTGIFGLRGRATEDPAEPQWPVVEQTVLDQPEGEEAGTRCPQCAVSQWRGATVCQGCGRRLTPEQREPAGIGDLPAKRATRRGARKSARGP
jgi:hypothetical protein